MPKPQHPHRRALPGRPVPPHRLLQVLGPQRAPGLVPPARGGLCAGREGRRGKLALGLVVGLDPLALDAAGGLDDVAEEDLCDELCEEDGVLGDGLGDGGVDELRVELAFVATGKNNRSLR